jgi:hypothetical protein
MLSLLLVVAIPAHAEGLRVNDVAQVLVNSGNTSQLRLRAVSQTSNLVVSGTNARQDPSNPQTAGGTSETPDASAQPTITQDPTAPNVEIIELGDVTGSVCDCGEIPGAIIPGKGFPLYPLFALGAIPLAFLDFGGEDETIIDNPPPPPPPPTPEPIPEPATLLMLGSGLAALGAGARRRRREQQAQESGEQTAIVKEA